MRAIILLLALATATYAQSTIDSPLNYAPIVAPSLNTKPTHSWHWLDNLPPPPAIDITVPVGGNLQAAVNNAACGDAVILEPGRWVTPGLEVPALILRKACAGNPITIRSNIALPVTFRDRTPEQLRALGLPQIVSNTATPAVEFTVNSSGYRIIGIEVTNDDRGIGVVNNGLIFAGVRHGSSPGLTLATVPRDIEWDRTWVHAKEDGTNSEFTTCLRGFWLGANDFRIVNSRVAGFSAFYAGTTEGAGGSTQAILIEKGPGPYTFRNNFLSAWFTTIFTGGGPQWVTNQATVSNVSMSQATLSNVNNLRVGDYIAFKVSGQGSKYQVARVTQVSGNVVNYVPQPGLPHSDPTLTPGNPLAVVPDTPGDAVWNGDVPKNISILNNTFWKNPVVGAAAAHSGRCDGGGCYGKGHIEFKTALDTLVEGNDFSGYAAGFTITSRNQSDEFTSGNNPWATITNLTFRNNRWSGLPRPGKGAIIGIQLNDNNTTTVQGRNVTFDNMLFENLPSSLLSIGGSPDVTFRNVTAIGAAPQGEDAMIGGHSAPSPNLRIENSILQNNEYGMVCSLASGCFTSSTITGTIIVDNRTQAKKDSAGPLANHYPAGNFFPATLALEGWKLPSTSPYKLKGTDGKDPGVDKVKLDAVMGDVVPVPTPTATPTPLPSPTVTPTPLPSPTPSPAPTPTPQPGMVTISGVTFSAIGGEPFPDITVVLSDANGVEVDRKQVQGDARYTFTRPPGSYQISVSQYGYNASPRRIDVSAGLDTPGLSILNFTLGPAEWFSGGPVMCHPVACVAPSPSPSPTPEPSPTPVPTPTPAPTPACTISAPDSIALTRNTSMDITVTLSTSDAVTTKVLGSDGQVTVTPLSQTKPSPHVYRISVKRHGRPITFTSPCGQRTMKVDVR